MRLMVGLLVSMLTCLAHAEAPPQSAEISTETSSAGKNAETPAAPSLFDQEMHRLSAKPGFETTESVVTIDGITYKKIVYQNKTYYISSLSTTNRYEVMCDRPGRRNSEPLVSTGATVVGRTKVFIEFLETVCSEDRNGYARTDLITSPRVGVALPNHHGDVVKNKKIYLPLNMSGLGFSGGF